MTTLSKEDAGILAMVHLNRLTPKLEVKKEWRLGRVKFIYNWRSSKNLWGRFGGGWNWELGFQAGGQTIILNLLVASLRITWWQDKKEEPAKP